MKTDDLPTPGLIRCRLSATQAYMDPNPPKATRDTPIRDAIAAMTEARGSLIAVVDADGNLLGEVTSAALRPARAGTDAAFVLDRTRLVGLLRATSLLGGHGRPNP